MDKNYNIYLDKILLPLKSALKKYEGQLYFHNSKLKDHTIRLSTLHEELETREEKEPTPEEVEIIEELEKKIRKENFSIKKVTKLKENMAKKIDGYRKGDNKNEIEEQIEEDLDKYKQQAVDKKERKVKKKEIKKN